MRQQIACNAAARNRCVQPPKTRAALRQILGDSPILQEFGAVMKDAPEAAFVQQRLSACVTAGTRR